MLQNLAKCSRTRRATTGLVSGSSPSIAHASSRFYATKANEAIVKLLTECADAESASAARNPYKVRSFRVAASAIEKLDFDVKHGNDLKTVRGIGQGIMDRVSVFLGHEEEHSPGASVITVFKEKDRRKKTIKKFMVIPGLGVMSAGMLYDAGCDTFEKMQLKKYKDMLSHKAARGLKYARNLDSPVPRENAEAIVEFCKYFMPVDKYEIVIAGDYRRDAPAIEGPIELLIIDSSDGPIPIPPHPSTLKPPGLFKPTRIKFPFSQIYLNRDEKITSVLLNKIIKPLEDMSVVTDTMTPGTTSWQGWMRVPKKGGSWQTRRERIEGIKNMEGDFHRVNVTFVPKRSRGSALLTLTGDEDYHFECTRKAVQAGLYLNEWGLWQWEPDSESLARFQKSDAPHRKTSLGAMWGSETEEDKGRWVQLETPGEEQILDAIGGEYVPPSKRNFRFIMGKTRPKRYPS